MRVRRWATGALTGAVAAVVATATAWACVSGPAVNLSTVNAKPGEEVQVTGNGFSTTRTDPVTARWGGLDGPIVGSLGAPQSGNVSGSIVVPADARPGDHVVVFTQTGPDGKLSQLPIRALLTVTPVGGAAPVASNSPAAAQVERPAGLVTSDNSVSGVTLALISLGVAGLGMFLAGIAALLAGGRVNRRQAVSAQS